MSITGEKGSDIALETVTAGSMNRAIPEGVQGLLSGSLRGIKAMKSELPECRYRREAAECERNAEQATMAADRLAWRQLAEDWTKLAMAAAVNPRLKERT